MSPLRERGTSALFERRTNILKKLFIVSSLLAAFVVPLVYPKAYVLRGSLSEGVLYWDANEALLFVGESNEGARMSYARYLLEPFAVGVGHVRQPDDKDCSRILVIRVTDKDVQRYDTDLYRYAEEPYCGMHFAMFDGRIYTGYFAEGKVWKWSDTRFEPTTTEDLRAFNAAKAGALTASHPWEFDNEEGWSMRALGETPPEYRFTLNGQPLTVRFHGETWPPAPLSLDVIRPNQGPQTVWSLDGRPHRVRKAEFETSFAQR